MIIFKIRPEAFTNRTCSNDAFYLCQALSFIIMYYADADEQFQGATFYINDLGEMVLEIKDSLDSEVFHYAFASLPAEFKQNIICQESN